MASSSSAILNCENWSSPRRLHGGDLAMSLGASPFTWLASPLPLEEPSPESTLSFSLSSPPHQTQKNSILSPTPERIGDFLSSHFSPSIFSPDEINGKFEKTGEQPHSSFPLFDDPLSPDFMLQDNMRDHNIELKYKSSNRVSSSSNLLHLTEEPSLPWPVKTARMISSDDDSGDENESNYSKIRRESSNDEGSTTKRQRKNHEQNVQKKQSSNKTNKKNAKSATTAVATIFTPESSSVPPVLSPDQQDFSRKLTLDSAISLSQDKNLITSNNHSASPKTTTITLKKSTVVVKSSNLETPTSISRTTCNCKKSKCLKLYCDCFAVLNYCNPSYCNCVQCNNVVEHEEKRSQAVRSTKERNPLAFQTKISEKEVHVSGCHCKNSHCLKKYCECFTGSALCSGNCKCQSCKNYYGSTELAKTRENSPPPPPPGTIIGGIIGSGSTSNSKKRKESPNSIAMLLENGSPDVQIREGPENMMKLSMKSDGSALSHTKKHEYSLRTSAKDVSTVKSALVSSNSGITKKKANENNEDVTTETAKVSNNKNKKKVNFPSIEITYPFFGPQNPSFPKIVALKCLDFLPDKDICRMSMVNSLWYEAANDAALWEYND